MEKIFVVGLLIEAIVETLKPIWDRSRREEPLGNFYGALIAGVVIALLGGFDIFKAVGVPLEFFAALGAYPGIVLTGILLGRGGNFIHELYKLIQGGISKLSGG